MHFDFAAILGPLVGLVATAVGAWIATRITKPKDHERAELLAKIAAGAAALVVALNPGASWATLLQQVEAQIATAAGLPTRNAQAIQRAAAEALSALGKAPNAAK